MKKALQIPYLRAPRILTERAVVSRLCEAQSRGFCDHFAEVFVANHARNVIVSGAVLRPWPERRPSGLVHRRFPRLGNRSRREREPRRRVLAETCSDVLGAALQLERPDRIARVDVQRAVAREPRGPRVPG